ncbi:MAG: HAD-IA family hydrolase [Anaerolineales bacterium]
MQKSQCQAVLFDLDGTLIKTEPMAKLILEDLYRAHREVEFTDEVFETLKGKPARDIIKTINPDQVDQLLEEIVQLEEKYRHLAPAYPGVPSLVKGLSERGYKLAVVTSQARPEMEAAQDHYPFASYIPVWISADDVEHPKPHPESVTKALSTLDVDPAQALFVGDSVYDVEAGMRAGVKTGVATWSGSDHRALLELDPHYVFEEPADILRVCEP